MAMDPDLDADDQDQAETFDETNLTEDGEDIARPDMMRNVYDVTSAEDDAEDDELEDDFDPDALDESEREALLEEDEGIDDDEGPETRDEGDLVAVDDDRPADFEGESQSNGPDDEDRPNSSEEVRRDRRRDSELDETFPASDPSPANPGSD
ncbi:MAG: primosomal protein [Caulobacteraceae bacterium]|nr:primosomal protein [Caulobacteraceae bacterium]